MKTDIMALIVFFMMGFNLCIPVIQKQFEIDTITVKADPLGDPPFNSTENLGYELLDNGSVFHMWNNYDSYYFNRSNGIQFSNHYQEFWTTNVLMLGYYAGDQWNLLYRTDELSGFTEVLDCVTDDYINVTLWKDLSYGSYDFRLALRYHLKVSDFDLTIIPYIKNLGVAIPFDIGFGWEMKNIQVDDNVENDQIRINGTSYLLNQTLDNKYTNITRTIYEHNETTNVTTNYTVKNGEFYLENINTMTGKANKDLYLKWNPELNYLIWVKSRDGQYNAPVTLFVKVGTLSVGQEKSTELYWFDATLIDSYSESNRNADGTLGDNHPSNSAWASSTGQSFTADETIDIGSAKFYMKKTGSPTGMGHAVLYAHSGTYGTSSEPTGGALATSDDFDVEDLTGDLALHTFTFTGGEQYELQATTKYCIVFENPSSGITTSDAPQIGYHSGGPSHDGNYMAYKNNDYVSYSTVDTCFYVYGDEGAPENTAPTITGEIPANTSTGIGLTPVCNVTTNDEDGGDTLDVCFYENTSGSYVLQQKNASVSPGTSVQWDSYIEAKTELTDYYWMVTVDDATDNVSAIYHFTTAANSTWQTLDTWNITLSNTTQSYILDTWNLTLSNTTQSYILDTWNITFSNTTQSYILDTWNLTLGNMTITPYVLDTWNITLSNLTISPYILDTWNITLSNTPQPYILDTWNLTLSNTTQSYTLDQWNITLSNLTISPYTLDTWNLTLSNTTESYVLDTWNLTLSNTTPPPQALVFSNENPSNTSTDQEIELTWNVTIESTNGDTFSWWINCSNGQESLGLGEPPYNTPSLPTSGHFEEKWNVSMISLGISALANPTIQDVNGDGIMEIFMGGRTNFTVGETDRTLRLISLNGSTGAEIWNETYDQGGDGLSNNYFNTLVYDFNKDGEYDVIVDGYAGNTIMRYATNGTEIWNKSDVKTGWHQQAYIDNGNNVTLLLVGGPGASTFIKKVNGSTGIIEDYTSQPYTCWGGVSIADLDDDGHYELFTTDRSTDTDRGLRCYNMTDLTLKWNKDIACSSQTATIADFDKDGELEVMVVDQGWPYHVMIYDVDGNLEHESSVRIDHHHQSAVGDVDGDGNLELVCGDMTTPTIYDLYSHVLEDNIPNWELIKHSGEIYDIIPDDNNISEILNTGDQGTVSSDMASIWQYNVSTEIYDKVYEFGYRIVWSVAADVDFDGYKELITGFCDNYAFGKSMSYYRCYETNVPVDIPAPITTMAFGGTRRLNNDEFIAPPGEYEYITYGENNGSKELILTGLDYSTEYTIWVNATDGTNWTREWYSFTTKAEFDEPPIIKNPIPSNNTGGQDLSFSWNVTIEDPEGSTFDWWINCSSGNTSSAATASNGTKSLALDLLSYSTEYTVWVNATDGTYWTRHWYNFTTISENVPPAFGTPDPANNSDDNALSLNWSISITDADVDDIDWTIECNNSQSSSAYDSRYIGASRLEGDGSQSFENDIVGIPWNMTGDTRARASNISIYWRCLEAAKNVTCGLYNADKGYIESTEERLLPIEEGAWMSLNFSYPEPIFEPSTQYYIVAFIQQGDGPGAIAYDYTSGDNSTVWGQFEVGYNSSNGELPEVWSPQQWGNDSTTLHMRCYYNSTLNGTKNVPLTGLSEDIQYTVWVNATDSTDWTNETYYFTTVGGILDMWNLTLSNTSMSIILDTWNLTLSNISISAYTLDTWNLTLSNTTESYTLDTWNVTLSNTSLPYILDTWNITLSNTPVGEILDRWNLTFSNTSFFFITDVKATPSEAVINDVTINITCNVTSTCAIVNVTVNMTGGVYDMISGIGDLYYYNAINSSIGTHYYHIYANDTSGDQQESATYSFRIIGLSCSFTYTVNGGLMTLTPTITGATHYQWTFINETGVKGITPWIPIGDIGSYIQGYVYPTIIRVLLSAKNINFNQYANYSDRVKINKSSFEKPEPTEIIEEEPDLKLKNIYDTGISDWMEERKPGEFLVIGSLILFGLVFLFKKRPKKTVIYTIKKENIGRKVDKILEEKK